MDGLYAAILLVLVLKVFKIRYFKFFLFASFRHFYAKMRIPTSIRRKDKYAIARRDNLEYVEDRTEKNIKVATIHVACSS